MWWAPYFFTFFMLSVDKLSYHREKYEISAQMNVMSEFSVKCVSMLVRMDLVVCS